MPLLPGWGSRVGFGHLPAKHCCSSWDLSCTPRAFPSWELRGVGSCVARAGSLQRSALGGCVGANIDPCHGPAVGL